MSLGGSQRAAARWSQPTPQSELGRLIDWEALGRLGLDISAACFAPDPGDPVFGFTECKAACCDQVAKTSLGLCWRCDQLWQKTEPGADFEAFCETVPDRVRHRRSAALCRVCRTPGHERPVRAHGLCAACENAMAKRGQSPDEYVAGDEEFPPATPRPSFGRCLVATCTRFAWRARPALCEQHYKKWDGAGRPAGTSLRSWCARQRSIDRDSRIAVLAGLAEGVRLEVLYGLQRAAGIGRRTQARRRPGRGEHPPRPAGRLGARAAGGPDHTGHASPPVPDLHRRPGDLGAGHTRQRDSRGRLGPAGLRPHPGSAALRLDQPAVAEGDGQDLGRRTYRHGRDPPGHAGGASLARGVVGVVAPQPPRRRRRPAPDSTSRSGRLRQRPVSSPGPGPPVAIYAALLAAPRRPVPRRGSRHGPEPARAPDGRASRGRRLPPGRPPPERLGRRAGTGAAADRHRPAPRSSRPGPPGGHARSRRACHGRAPGPGRPAHWRAVRPALRLPRLRRDPRRGRSAPGGAGAHP